MRCVDEDFRCERLACYRLPGNVGDLQEIGRFDCLGLRLGEKGTDRAVAFSGGQLLYQAC